MLERNDLYYVPMLKGVHSGHFYVWMLIYGIYMNSGCLKLNKYYLNYGQNMVIIMKISVDFYFYSKKSELSSGGNEAVFIK